MAGSPPPPDAPSPAEQDLVSADAGFALGPPAASLCGFKIPTFSFSISLNINIKLPPFPPKFSFSIGLSCDGINFSAGLDFGGGRKATFDPDPDDQLAAA